MSETPINEPSLWKDKLPRLKKDGHKYDRGHAVICGAPEMTGATRLAAEACARIGAGLVTVLSPKDVVNVYRTALPPHIIVRDDLGWHDDRVTARLYGCGGLPVQPDYKTELPTVLDAGALADLPEKLSPNFVLTPHEGEFAKAFPDIKGDKAERAKQAAKQINAHIILKGPETIIAAPDGHAVLNDHASPALATAGTGDVLAGIITGLLAQDMPIFDAACAAVWFHGDCGLVHGRGLTASDIPDLLPTIIF